MRSHQVLWPLDPHTQAKHAILRRYLDAWLPIMSRWNSRVLYIDGFAGPGRYRGGEDGSPIIALKAALEHTYALNSEIEYLFIEADPQRLANLERELDRLALPRNFRVRTKIGQFGEAVAEFLDELDHEGQRLPPTFAFVDPFGWKYTPLSLIKRLLANPRCEALITFMYEEINRFIGADQQAENWMRLFGTEEWRPLLDIQGAAERRQAMRSLYERQLKNNVQARFVRWFEMRNKNNATDYFLFFATNSPKGLGKMKDAMWTVDPSGAFLFSDATMPGQPVLFGSEPDFALLRRQLETQFVGETVDIEDVQRFVLEETAFKDTHFRRRVLAVMETEHPPSIHVSGPPGRRRGQFPPGTRVEFVRQPTLF